MLLRSSLRILPHMRRSRVAVRNSSCNSSCNNSCNNSCNKKVAACPHATTADDDKKVVVAVGAAVGVVMCIVAKLKCLTDCEYVYDHQYRHDTGEWIMAASGAAVAGSTVAFTGMIYLPLGGIAAMIAAMDWFECFPDLLNALHKLRHKKKEE